MEGTKRILIAEDEAKVAFFLQESLESLDEGYQVIRVTSGEEALEELARVSFDLVVSDLRMPGINGLELLQRVHEQSPATQTILITAYGSDEVEAETRRLRTYRYFTKPFHIEEFTAAVSEALQDGVSRKMSGLLVLSEERFDQMTQRLSELRYEVGAQCILLSDSEGQVLAERGSPDQLQTTELASLMSCGFVNAFEVAQHLRDDRSFSLHYYEGTRYDIYTANLGKRFFVTLIFDRRQGASRAGMVWLYVKRAIQDLLYLIDSDDVLPPTNVWSEGYGVKLN